METLNHWAERYEGERLQKEEYLVSPPQFSDLWIKRELLENALKPLNAKFRGDEVDIMESKGGNMEVHDFILEDFEKLLIKWLELIDYPLTPQIVSKAQEAAKLFTKRFVFKIGNTHDYVICLGANKASFRRDLMEDVFAELGFLVYHTERRVKTLAQEVVRYDFHHGNTDENPITGPNIYDEIRRFLDNPLNFDSLQDSDYFYGHDEGKNRSTILDFHEGPEKDTDSYHQANVQNRKAELNLVEEDLKPFFDGVVTIGLHDFLRRISGYDRQTNLNYDQLSKILKDLCKKYEDESFLVPEQITYGYDPRITAEEWQELIQNNQTSVNVLAFHLFPLLPSHLKELFQINGIANEFCHCILEHHHEIPEYEVDEATTVVSSTMLKFIFKAAYTYLCFRYQENPQNKKREDFFENQKLREFFSNLTEEDAFDLWGAVQSALNIHKKIVKRKRCPEYKRLERTQVKTQDRLDYVKENKLIEGPLSVCTLINERPDLLNKYPEIAEKLIVLYFRTYKMFKKTGYMPDHRPENLLKYLFGMGEWAVQTENIQIRISKTPEGETVVDIINIDPEDHFKISPENEDKRNPNEGLATYGFNMVGLSSRSILKAISRFSEVVAKDKKITGHKSKLSSQEWIEQWAKDFIRESKQTTSTITRATIRSIKGEIKRHLKGMCRLFI